MIAIVSLREVHDSDLDVFFANEADPEGRHMAAFTSRDPTDWQAFLAHWGTIRADPQAISRAIICDGRVAGSVGSWQEEDAAGAAQREVGYWIGRQFWGQGIATRALRLYVREVPQRPLFAHVATDNAGSIRVLEKCGFTRVGEDLYFAQARGAEIPEFLMRLDA